MRSSYDFGVEIEIIAKPSIHYILDDPNTVDRSFYYGLLAYSLRQKDRPALADSLQERYRKHSEHYDKWWITKDGSLGNPPHPEIPLEVVSPILSTSRTWEGEIDVFWEAFTEIFQTPEKSPKCGSHIHISPGREKSWSRTEIKNIAFGIVFYEPLIKELLPSDRRNNSYCKPNTSFSYMLRGEEDLGFVWHMIDTVKSKEHLRDVMQEGNIRDSTRNRHVLWNFDNILPGKSGTIEFRGGSALQDSESTKRWISFVVSFIHLCITQDFHSFPQRRERRPTLEVFWQDILHAARSNAVRSNLPSSHAVMAEDSWYAATVLSSP
ncbi:putative amidoligase enzyme-domain-containing protein [Aspergillus cavernicola]|uniref:Amidoligase enzyme-domain-containing protein n=1 Tax=Aspergillus cavernicola TaxID=176166 RepID=A0ABR4IEK8_9EURO